jgi:tRNA A37 threonylcarbamoyladenosine biosynthesis protein TsaE
MKIIRPKSAEVFNIELGKDLLARDKSLARGNRKKSDGLSVSTVDVMGSIESGKTSLNKAILKKPGMGQKAASP